MIRLDIDAAPIAVASLHAAASAQLSVKTRMQFREDSLDGMRELLACPDSKGVLGTLGILNVFVCPPLRSLFRNVRPSTRLLS